MRFLEQVYSQLPVSLQNLACTLHGFEQRKLRFGGEFYALYDWLEESQWWTTDQIKEYKNELLRNLVDHAYQTTTYYRRLFDENGIRPADIQTVDDLVRVPLLSKEDVRQHLHEMISCKFREKELVRGHTSGSTGKSLQLLTEPRAIQFRWAVWSRHKRRFGILHGASYASFTGLVVVPLKQKAPPFWRHNRAMHQTIFPMHHITPDKIKPILDRLNCGDFEYYTGYPSILCNLAELILDQNLRVTAPPKVIFTGAENIYEHQRKLISNVFQCVVTDQYGFSEGCGNASRCEADLFHEDFEYGHLECIDPETIDQTTTLGRIVCTGFSSFAVPFIRYDVGDVAVWTSCSCGCGRKSATLQRIEGRSDDYVITPEGSRIQRFDYIFKDTTAVKEAQIVQRELGRITIRLVCRSNYSQADEVFIRREVAQRVSSSLHVDFEYTDEIEREPNGKFRAVKSFLSPSAYNGFSERSIVEQ